MAFLSWSLTWSYHAVLVSSLCHSQEEIQLKTERKVLQVSGKWMQAYDDQINYSKYKSLKKRTVLRKIVLSNGNVLFQELNNNTFLKINTHSRKRLATFEVGVITLTAIRSRASMLPKIYFRNLHLVVQNFMRFAN